MGTLREWVTRLVATFTGHRTDRDLEEELRLHLDLAAAHHRGTSTPLGFTQAMDALRDQRGLPWLDDMKRDVRYALRGLARTPWFTAATVLTLAVGIGANTAIFTLVDTVLLKKLPVKDPDELVALTNPTVAGASGGLVVGERAHVSFDEYEALRNRMESVVGLIAVQAYTAALRTSVNGQPPEDARTKLVSGGYFDLLGVPAYLGRAFTAGDEHGPGTAPFAVISYEYWQRRLGRAASAVGSRLKVGDAALTIIGVAPPRFFGESVGEAPEIWIPLAMQRQVMPGVNWLNNAQGNMMWLHAIGRLKRGTTYEQAQANADVVFKQILNEESSRLARPIPDIFKQSLRLRDASTGLSSIRGRFGDPLYMLMGMVAMVLAVACGNVATLLLARAESRQKEIAVRLAIGASRFRIVRQLLTESLTLSCAGAVLGTLIATVGVRFLTRTVLGEDASQLQDGVDSRTLWFTLSLSVLTALVFGSAPAWRAARLNVGDTLETGTRIGQWSTAKIGTTKLFAIGQIALAIILLIGAGWFLKTLRNLQTVDLGYPRQQLAQLRVNFAPAGYAGDRLPVAYEELRTRLVGVPGVSAVAYSTTGLFGDNYGPVVIEGRTAEGASDSVAKLFGVGPSYFSAVGIPLIRGREIGSQDVASALLVCVVNEAFATYYFGTDDPIGRRVVTARTPYTVVGVTRDVRDNISYPKSLADSLRGEVPRTLYRPFLQTAQPGRYPAGVTYQVRTRDVASAVLPAIRSEVASFNPAITIAALRSLDSMVDDQVRQERVVAQLSTAFGGVALLLACVGLSGVLSYAVARRTHEIGIRMALGARRGVVMRMILREMAVLVIVGVAIGVPASLACARFVQAQLFGLTPADPLTLVASLGIMVAVALGAGFLPAHGASTIDPLVALRSE